MSSPCCTDKSGDGYPRSHFLHRYGSQEHFAWHKVRGESSSLYYRRLGIVESLFDADGRLFEGRADLSLRTQVELRTSLPWTNSNSKADTSLDEHDIHHLKQELCLRDRITLAWSVLRQKHVLLSCKALTSDQLQQVLTEQNRDLTTGPEQAAVQDTFFVYTKFNSIQQTLEDGSQHVVFLEDFYPDMAPSSKDQAETNCSKFWFHLSNTGRVIDAKKGLAKLFVLPPFPNQTENGFTWFLDFIIVAAHEVADGLTAYRWRTSLIDLLNGSGETLLDTCESFCSKDPSNRLPPPQEALYPLAKGSRARQKWFWLITRLLRHTRKPPPASFQNPLRRSEVLEEAQIPSPEYGLVLDYQTPPKLNSYTLMVYLSKNSTHHISRLCRAAGVSVGSGCFAMAGIAMMMLHEQRYPDIPLEKRLPFVGSFPINPRPFLSGPSTSGAEDSLMLAFSDGITLPFLPRSTPLLLRFRVLSRLAHRQLRQFQKRKRSADEEIHLGSKSNSQLLPALYLSTSERLKMHARWTLPEYGPDEIQGNYPAAFSPTLATCAISSIGDTSSLISSGKYDVTSIPEGKDTVADFRNGWATVRARDGEFLCGVGSDKDLMGFGVSYDGSSIDPNRVQEWKRLIEGMMENDIENQRSTVKQSKL